MPFPTTLEELNDYVSERIEYAIENLGLRRAVEEPGMPLRCSTRFVGESGGIDCDGPVSMQPDGVYLGPLAKIKGDDGSNPSFEIAAADGIVKCRSVDQTTLQPPP